MIKFQNLLKLGPFSSFEIDAVVKFPLQFFNDGK